MRSGTGGFTVLEAVVGLLLTLLLGTLVMATLAAQRRVQSALTREAELLAAVRIARHVVGGDVRAQGGAGPGSGEDGGTSGDSLALRSFRGHAIVCPPAPAGALVTVWPEGMRGAEGGRDSVVVWPADAPPVVRLLVEREPGGCPPYPEGAWERWTLSEPVPPGAVFVRYFRRGSYHVANRAVRYRSGDGTRQPLTPEVLDDRRSGFVRGAGGTLLELAPGRGPAWTVRIPGGGP